MSMSRHASINWMWIPASAKCATSLLLHISDILNLQVSNRLFVANLFNSIFICTRNMAKTGWLYSHKLTAPFWNSHNLFHIYCLEVKWIKIKHKAVSGRFRDFWSVLVSPWVLMSLRPPPPSRGLRSKPPPKSENPKKNTKYFLSLVDEKPCDTQQPIGDWEKLIDTLIGSVGTYGHHIMPREFLTHKQCCKMPRKRIGLTEKTAKSRRSTVTAFNIMLSDVCNSFFTCVLGRWSRAAKELVKRRTKWTTMFKYRKCQMRLYQMLSPWGRVGIIYFS